MMLIQLSPRLARHLASQSLDGIKLLVFLKYNDLKVTLKFPNLGLVAFLLDRCRPSTPKK